MILCLPFLMFQGRAQEAIDHYLETFPDAELLEILHHPEGTEVFDPDQNDDGGAPAQPASYPTGPITAPDTAAMEAVVDWEQTLVATAQLRIGGQVLMIQDSLVKQDFDFTPSVSVAVVVETENEFDQIVHGLFQGGGYLMEPGHYEFAKNFAWVQDKFGMTWQINQPLNAPGAASEPKPTEAKAPDWS